MWLTSKCLPRGRRPRYCSRDLGGPGGTGRAWFCACRAPSLQVWVCWRACSFALAALPARAVEAVNVPRDAPAIDLTAAVERSRTENDRIQVSAAPGRRRHRPAHGRARPRGRHQLGGVRAGQFGRGSDRPPDRHSALPHGRLRPAVARPRRSPASSASRRAATGPTGRTSATADVFRITLDPGAVMTYVDGTAHRQAHPDLSVGAGRLQGQGQQHHALLRHRDRHRRPAGALPHHPVRGQRQRDVPGRRRARLGGACLYRHRLRLLGQGVRDVDGGRAGSGAPPAKPSSPRRWSSSCSPISISTAGMCATPTSRSPGSRAWPRWWRSRCSIRRWRPASRGFRCLRSPGSALRWSSISRCTAMTAPCC